ncbi:MAG: hypothetical protein JWP52_1711 [Rhizobacter sp.]|nr:hypothetical protein [Rhizobacter sp.]
MIDPVKGPSPQGVKRQAEGPAIDEPVAKKSKPSVQSSKVMLNEADQALVKGLVSWCETATDRKCAEICLSDLVYSFRNGLPMSLGKRAGDPTSGQGETFGGVISKSPELTVVMLDFLAQSWMKRPDVTTAFLGPMMKYIPKDLNITSPTIKAMLKAHATPANRVPGRFAESVKPAPSPVAPAPEPPLSGGKNKVQ